VNEPLSTVSITEAEKTAALVKLARTMAHELNNIFTVVGGNLALLDEAISPDDPMAETIEEMQQALARAVLLSSKLQALSSHATTPGA
jgi:signal transduction histidine kinase